MPWNSTWPVGNVSVKTNRTSGQQNTTYTETTMGNSVIGTNTVTTRDHFWNVGANEDGRHRFIQSPAFTVGSVATDPVIGTGMDGVRYLKTVSGRVQGFYRNAQGIYQYIPAFLSGSVVLPGTYADVVAVPANSYGQVAMYTTARGILSGVTAHFRSDATVVETWGLLQSNEASTTNNIAPLKFASGTDATTLFIRARARDAAAGQTWNYRITYRAL